MKINIEQTFQPINIQLQSEDEFISFMHILEFYNKRFEAGDALRAASAFSHVLYDVLSEKVKMHD